MSLVARIRGLFLRKHYRIDMPEEGWGLHITEYVCEWCGPGREESAYRNPDHKIHSALDGHELTEQELALELHRNDYHRWDDKLKVWLP